MWFPNCRNTATPTTGWSDKIFGNDAGKLWCFFPSSFQLQDSVIGHYLLLKHVSFFQLSKPIKGGEAHQLGLVDALVSPNDLVNTARQWALDIYECRRPWIKSLYKTDKLEPLGEAREILKFARAQAQKQAANLHHPLVCIDVIEEGIVAGPRAGLWKVLDMIYVPLC